MAASANQSAWSLCLALRGCQGVNKAIKREGGRPVVSLSKRDDFFFFVCFCYFCCFSSNGLGGCCCLGKAHDLSCNYSVVLFGMRREGLAWRWVDCSSIFSNLTFSNLTNLSYLDIQGGVLEGTFQFSVLSNLSKLDIVGIYSKGGLEIDTEYPISWVPFFQLILLSVNGCVVNTRSINCLPSFL